MKIEVGNKVGTDFGNGKVVAMSRDWCIVAPDDFGDEVAIPWEEVRFITKPEVAVSSITAKDL